MLIGFDFAFHRLFVSAIGSSCSYPALGPQTLRAKGHASTSNTAITPKQKCVSSCTEHLSNRSP